MHAHTYMNKNDQVQYPLKKHKAGRDLEIISKGIFRLKPSIRFFFFKEYIERNPCLAQNQKNRTIKLKA